jgi:hypothetical protein
MQRGLGLGIDANHRGRDTVLDLVEVADELAGDADALAKLCVRLVGALLDRGGVERGAE